MKVQKECRLVDWYHCTVLSSRQYIGTKLHRYLIKKVQTRTDTYNMLPTVTTIRGNQPSKSWLKWTRSQIVETCVYKTNVDS